MKLPSLISHADWSTGISGRMLVLAKLQSDGTYLASSPQRPPSNLLDALREQASDGVFLAGFDFPIGLPKQYTARAKIDCFLSWLDEQDDDSWRLFRSVAVDPNDIHVGRPSYPAKPGGTSQSHLLQAHGVASIRELKRGCDRQAKACCIFWTLGAKQVGRAALAGWHEILRPALGRRDEFAIWPFHGSLNHLLNHNRSIVSETYPASFYKSVGITAPFAKTSQQHRRKIARSLHHVAHCVGLIEESDLTAAIDDGFGPKTSGQDAFDAVIGLLGMLLVLRGRRPADPPDELAVRRVEGWMLGLDPLTLRG